jgi:hypothetical protein
MIPILYDFIKNKMKIHITKENQTIKIELRARKIDEKEM